MNVMLSERYDALISAGADEAKARRASETLATTTDAAHRQFAELREDNQKLRTETAELRSDLKNEMAALSGRIDNDITGLRGGVMLLKWMMGVLIALNSAILLKVFFA